MAESKKGSVGIYKSSVELQRDLAGKVIIREFKGEITLVGGTDVSYSRVGKDVAAIAGLVVMKYGTWEIVEKVYAEKEIAFPYIPGLLSFRELPVLLDAFEKLETNPDLWLVDGAGIAHPRRLGLAAHFGITIGRPAVGVAKSRLTGSHVEVPEEKGSSVPLYDGDEIIGTVLRSRTRVRPLYISPGHLVSMDQAAPMVLSCCGKYRLPEPTRAAHNFVTALRQKFRSS